MVADAGLKMEFVLSFHRCGILFYLNFSFIVNYYLIH